MTNSLAFKPGEPGVIYITQGSMNAMGAPDNAWANRAEHLLAAAILRVNTNLLISPPLNVQTNDADPASTRLQPVRRQCPGHHLRQRRAQRLRPALAQQRGALHARPTVRPPGGSTPATPSTLPSACTRRIDNATNGPYTGPPSCPGITGNPIAEDDYLYRIVQGGYYGHPNPSRCEWVLNGGNPTTGVRHHRGRPPIRWASSPTGTGGARRVQLRPRIYSPNGMIEWKATSVPFLMGKLLVIRYSGGDDIIVLTLDPPTKAVSNSLTGDPRIRRLRQRPAGHHPQPRPTATSTSPNTPRLDRPAHLAACVRDPQQRLEPQLHEGGGGRTQRPVLRRRFYGGRGGLAAEAQEAPAGEQRFGGGGEQVEVA